jgi:hypothetical protein
MLAIVINRKLDQCLINANRTSDISEKHLSGNPHDLPGTKSSCDKFLLAMISPEGFPLV